ncbi:MAG: prolyl oligopeptidase family serine peptidase [Vicinamibacterales bacterium]
MRRKTTLLLFVAIAAFSLQDSGPPKALRAAEPRAMELSDILAWKSIGATALSNDGQWFAYRVSPLDGDSEVMIRQTRGDKEYRFPIGDLRGGGAAGPAGGAGGADPAFSGDAKWLAFSVAPTKKEAAQLRRQRRPVQNKVSLVELATGKETRIEKIRRFAFSGEKGTWIALHRYGADVPSGTPAAGGASVPAGGGAGSAASERPRGSDLILHELATGAELNIGNVSEFAFDKTGRWLAWTVDAQDQIGNGISLRDMETGAVIPLDSGKAVYERLAWTDKGDGLAVLKGTEDKRYSDKVYAIVAFTGFSGPRPEKVVYDPATDKTFPEGMAISPNRNAAWTEDLTAILFGIREPKKAEPKPGAKPAEKPGEKPEEPADKPAPGDPPGARPDTPDAEEKPDLVLWHYLDKRLPTQQQVQETADRNFSYLSIYRVKEKKFIRLADDDLRSVVPAPKERWAIGSDTDDYELMGNMDGRRYQDVYVVDLQTGARKLALKKARWVMGPSTDGTRFLYYEDGNFFAYDMASGKAANLTATIPTTFVNLRDDHNVAKPPVSNPIEWTVDGSAVLLSDAWDIWLVPMNGSAATNLTVNGKKEGIQYGRRLRLDPEERGIDLSKPNYFGAASDVTKETGIVRMNPGKPGVERLAWGPAMFRRLVKADKADVYLYTRETYNQPPDYYVTGPSLEKGQKITTLDAQVPNFSWSSGSQLLDYTVTLGKGGKPQKLQASLFLPANYEKGKSYPTIVYIYERLTANHYGFTQPSANGFNKSVYTSNGYAVLMPDITYKLNDPGMSAVWCVVPAVQAAIKTGIVDARRVGIHGHSWGGYQTAFLVTQTDAFAAAVAGAPLTNMVSMYSLIYKNTGGANQAIFESSQGRFLGHYLDNWEAYIRNSPVNHAKNVKTPLMILHNDRDGAVDFTQGVEYFNTLRRLGKNVVMLEYVGENHGLAKPANQQDYTVRMKEFFDHHLMGKPAPDWYKEGVPRLKMDEHLKQRLEQQKKKITT